MNNIDLILIILISSFVKNNKEEISYFKNNYLLISINTKNDHSP